jgi:ATP-dependent DNA helicase DinG
VTAPNSLSARALRAFGADGWLARVVPQYEDREPQRVMVEAVAHAFEQDSRLLIEAGTGTGKTLGYLIPALLSGKRTIVSTATKALQEQIFQKDIPLLRKVLPTPFTAEYLKGRQNYLCLWRYDVFRQQPTFTRSADEQHWSSIESWIETTRTGDRAELTQIPEEYSTWNELTVGTEACLGSKCTFYQECFVVKARQRAAEANVVVVNHHLYFADLAIRQREGAELLPHYDAIVFDEAHHLEDIAGNFFGMSVSSWRVLDLCTDARKFLGEENQVDENLAHQLLEIDRLTQSFSERMAGLVRFEDSRLSLAELRALPGAEDLLAEISQSLAGALARLGDAFAARSQRAESAERLRERSNEIAMELGMLIAGEIPNMVCLVEIRRRGFFLLAQPVDLSDVFRRMLYGTCGTQIFTSATLTTSSGFDFYRRRMGLPESTEQVILDPVFDYMEQSILYIPEHLPRPSDPRFVEEIAPTIEQLIRITGGKAFVLFTSYRNMTRAFELLHLRLPYKCLMQGERSKSALLETFRTEVNSVLFATSSFWEGVDVQGEALSLVIIDKLPFSNHNDPVTSARLKSIEDRGGKPFIEYQVPQATITLKQGIGRLIRHRQDRGIVALLDQRILDSSYGRTMLSGLPRSRRTRDLEIVRRWWEAGRK